MKLPPVPIAGAVCGPPKLNPLDCDGAADAEPPKLNEAETLLLVCWLPNW